MEPEEAEQYGGLPTAVETSNPHYVLLALYEIAAHTDVLYV